jgi:hypothetical protein
MMRSKELWTVVVVGAILGGLGVMLAAWGNPENSGICVSCFIENSAGALGLHDNPNMQYLRPYSGPGFLGQRNEVNFLFKETANGKECSSQSRCSERRA